MTDALPVREPVPDEVRYARLAARVCPECGIPLEAVSLAVHDLWWCLLCRHIYGFP